MGAPGLLTKICTKCDQPRVIITHFYSYGGKREKRARSICKTCHSQQDSERKKANPAKYNAIANLRYASSKKARAYSVWDRAKKRAAKSGIDFSISREFVESRVFLGKCEATGVEFDLSKSKVRNNPNAPTVDKIDPKLGYTEANSRIVTWIYNRAKGDGTDEDVINFAREVLNAIKNT